MKRRNLLAGLGAAVSGGAAMIGTGAFSSTQADRSVSVEIASDNPGAYLGLDETDGLPNSGAAFVSGGEVQINLNGTLTNRRPGSGDGLSTRATTELDGVFKVINQAPNGQTLFVNIDSLDFNNKNVELKFYPGENSDLNLDSDSGRDLEVAVGDSEPIGVQVEIPGSAAVDSFDKDTTVTATNTNDTGDPIKEGDYTDPEDF